MKSYSEVIERLKGVTLDNMLGGRVLEIDYAIRDVVGDGAWISYTGSIDGATTLIPKNTDWHVDRVDGDYYAAVYIGDDYIEGKGPTAALAVCIAALSALEQADLERVAA